RFGSRFDGSSPDGSTPYRCRGLGSSSPGTRAARTSPNSTTNRPYPGHTFESGGGPDGQERGTAGTPGARIRGPGRRMERPAQVGGGGDLGALRRGGDGPRVRRGARGRLGGRPAQGGDQPGRADHRRRGHRRTGGRDRARTE